MKTKHFILTLAAIILTITTTGCSDNKLPEVQLGFKQTGGVEKDGVLNVCNGDMLSIDEVYVVAENSTPSTTIFRTDYYWDNIWIGQRIAPPFGFNFLIDVNRTGLHTLTLFTVVGANGYSLTNCVTNIPVYVHPEGTDLSTLGGIQNPESENSIEK